MCKPKAEGGKRCYGHGKAAYEGARARLAGLPENASTKRVEKAESSYETAVDKFAANRDGHKVLWARVHNLNAGAAPEGDRLAVIEDALTAHAHVGHIPRPRQSLEGAGLVSSTPAPTNPTPTRPVEFATNLADALRTGLPLERADRSARSVPTTKAGDTALAASLRTGELSDAGDNPRTRSRAAGEESSLARALRTGEPIPGEDTATVDNAGVPDQPVTIDSVTILRGQTPFIQRWGSDPVQVTERKSVRHFKGDGWSEYDYTTGGFRAVSNPDGDTTSESLFGQTGVLVVENVRTGEQGAVRARWDANTNVWHIHEDITA